MPTTAQPVRDRLQVTTELPTLTAAERSMPSSCGPAWLALFLISFAAMLGGAAMRPRSQPTCGDRGGTCVSR